MSGTGVTSLDHTIQETIAWLKAVEKELQLDIRQQASNALRAVLHALRDRAGSRNQAGCPLSDSVARHLL